MSAGQAVHFSVDAPPGRHVELCGDLPDWKYPVVMAEVSPGHYRTTLQLGPGVYRYKFRVDQRDWVLDPRAPAVDEAEGNHNGVITVGGPAQPVCLTPDREHLWHAADGTLVVHFELDPETPVPRFTWGNQALHIQQLQQRHGRVQGVACGVGGGAGALAWDGVSMAVTGPVPAVDAAPSWLHGSVFYGIFLDRWHRGVTSPPLAQASPRGTLSDREVFYGGDLHGVREGLPYLQQLGVTALVLTPLHPSSTPHRYDSTNLAVLVAPELGGETALRALVKDAHGRGMRVVLDAAVTHVSLEHAAFQDVLLHQQRSDFAPWFHIHRFPVVPGDASTYAHYYNNPQLPWLNLAAGPAREHVLDVVEGWMALGVDGLRLDAMLDAPADFWTALRMRARRANPDVLLLGEIVGDRPLRLGEGHGVDTATDFTHRSLLLDWLARRHLDARTFWESLAFHRHRKGPVPPSFHLQFLDNHDTRRFLSDVGNHDVHRLALLWLLTCPQPAWLTYGAELGAFGGGEVTELDGAWSERIPMPPLNHGSSSTHALVRALCALRREQPALLHAPMTCLTADGARLLVHRPHPLSPLLVAFNPTATPWDLTAILPPGRRLLLCVNSPSSEDTTTLLPWSGAVWQGPVGWRPS